MLTEGTIVLAKIVRIEQYGVYLEYGNSSILLLGPDASPRGDVPVACAFKAGEQIQVRIGRYSAADNTYRGFLATGQQETSTEGDRR